MANFLDFQGLPFQYLMLVCCMLIPPAICPVLSPSHAWQAHWHELPPKPNGNEEVGFYNRSLLEYKAVACWIVSKKWVYHQLIYVNLITLGLGLLTSYWLGPYWANPTKWCGQQGDHRPITDWAPHRPQEMQVLQMVKASARSSIWLSSD